MKDTKKYEKSRQLHKEGYLQENRVELKGNVETHSISSMSKEGRNGVDEYGSDLLEQILSRDNMNNAYKRVKANKGSHGIDGKTVDRPWKFKFLGFSFYREKDEYRIRIHEKPLNKFKVKLKELTSRSNAMNMDYRLLKLKQAVVGWVNYFAIADMKSILKALDKWLRRRIRMCFWKQWKKIRTKHDNLVKLGVEDSKAWEYANIRKGYWRISNSPILSKAITNKYLKKTGLVSIFEVYSLVH